MSRKLFFIILIVLLSAGCIEDSQSGVSFEAVMDATGGVELVATHDTTVIDETFIVSAETVDAGDEETSPDVIDLVEVMDATAVDSVEDASEDAVDSSPTDTAEILDTAPTTTDIMVTAPEPGFAHAWHQGVEYSGNLPLEFTVTVVPCANLEVAVETSEDSDQWWGCNGVEPSKDTVQVFVDGVEAPLEYFNPPWACDLNNDGFPDGEGNRIVPNLGCVE